MGKKKVIQKVLNFSLESQNVYIKNLLQKDFIEIEVWAISDSYPNNNDSHFPYKTLLKNQKQGNFYNKPVLGYWNNNTLNYEVHNGSEEDKVLYDPEYDLDYYDYSCGERPIGFVRKEDEVRIEEKDGIHWIVFSAIIWVKYNYNGVKELLKSHTKKVSAEVSIYKYHIDDNGIEIYDDWSFDGVTLLGYLPNTKIPAHEGIEGAHMNIHDKINTVFSQDIKNLYSAYDKYNKEKKGEFNLLTVKAQMDLLNGFLAEDLDKNEYAWVMDLDINENICYFYYKGTQYSAKYSIDEENSSVFINLEEKQKIVGAWKNFSNNYNCIINDLNCDFTIGENECSISLGEDKCSIEDMVKDFLSYKEELENCKSEFNTYKEQAEKCQEELENCKLQLEECNKTFTIDDNEIDAKALYDMYLTLKEDYSNLYSTSFVEIEGKKFTVSEMKEECDNLFAENSELKKDIFEMKIADMSEKIKVLAFNENLSKEQLEEILNNCKQGKYKDFECATKDIAYASFLNKDHAKKNSSFQILDKNNKSTNIQEGKPFDKLEKFINK